MRFLSASPTLGTAVMFFAGGAMIRYFCNPATFRRRFAVLGLYSSVAWWCQRRDSSTALFWNAVANYTTDDDMLQRLTKRDAHAVDFFLCLPILANLRPGLQSKNYKAAMSEVTDEMVQTYLAEEERRYRNSSMYFILTGCCVPNVAFHLLSTT